LDNARQAQKQKELLDSLDVRQLFGRQRDEALQRFETEHHNTLWSAAMESIVCRLAWQKRDYLDEPLYRNIGKYRRRDRRRVELLARLFETDRGAG